MKQISQQQIGLGQNVNNANNANNALSIKPNYEQLNDSVQAASIKDDRHAFNSPGMNYNKIDDLNNKK